VTAEPLRDYKFTFLHGVRVRSGTNYLGKFMSCNPHIQLDPRNIAKVATALAERDRNDSTRAASPLAIAPDATVVDTTGVPIDVVIEDVLALIRTRPMTDDR